MKLLRKPMKNWNSCSESYLRFDSQNDYKESNYNYCVENIDGIIVANFMSDAIVFFTRSEWKCLCRKDSCEKELLDTAISLGIIIPRDKNESADLIEKRIKNTYQSDTYYFTILPTQRCNARCAYCYSQQDEHKSMTLEIADNVIKFINNTVKEKNIIRINWFGGEPLLNTQIISYISNKLKQNHIIDASITTNGSLLSRELLLQMKEEWIISRIILPLDGYGEIHNQRKNYLNRKIDAYGHIIKTIENALDLGIEVIINMNYDRDNFPSTKSLLEDLKRFADNDAFYLRPNAIFPPEKLINNNEVNFIQDDYNDKIKQLLKWLDEYGFYSTIEKMIPKRIDFGCSYSDPQSYVIAPDGSLLKCLRKSTNGLNSVGNCLDGVVKNSEYLHAIESVFPDKECLECNCFPICQGGCILREEMNLDGDIKCSKNTRGLNAVLEHLYNSKEN